MGALWCALVRCAQEKIIAQGVGLPKRDIVDTIFHASRKTGQISAIESALPTMWERTD